MYPNPDSLIEYLLCRDLGHSTPLVHCTSNTSDNGAHNVKKCLFRHQQRFISCCRDEPGCASCCRILPPCSFGSEPLWISCSGLLQENAFFVMLVVFASENNIIFGVDMLYTKFTCSFVHYSLH